MLLTVDVGNTHVNFGIFSDNGNLVKKFKVGTLEIIKSKTFTDIPFNKTDEIKEVYMCSVVPEVNSILKEFIEQKLKVECKRINKKLKLAIENLYDNPEEVGEDRLVNAFGVNKLYHTPALIVDFGTAVTFDYINEKGEYEGGLIFPGLSVSLEALVEKSSLLPYIKCNPPSRMIGKNTVESMNNGIFYGYCNMADGIIKSLKKNISDENMKVIGTGGDVGILKGCIKGIEKYDADLTLKGLYYLSKVEIGK